MTDHPMQEATVAQPSHNDNLLHAVGIHPGSVAESSQAAMPLREAALREAISLTMGNRNAVYGSPLPNHEQIADIFFAITGIKLTASQVAMLHVATKLARLSKNPDHNDSYVDAMAYLGIAFECASVE
jgi:hypothetical protein